MTPVVPARRKVARTVRVPQFLSEGFEVNVPTRICHRVGSGTSARGPLLSLKQVAGRRDVTGTHHQW